MRGPEVSWVPARLRVRSLSGRLAVLFAAATLLLLAASETVMYAVLAEIVHRQANLILSGKVGVLRRILAERPGDADALRQEVQWEEGAWRHQRCFSRVLDAHGKTLLETEGMQRDLAGARFPEPVGPTQGIKHGTIWEGEEEQFYLLGSAHAGTSLPESPGLILQVALDLSREEDILEDYRHGMALALMACSGLAAFLGLITARRGLRPLEAIVRETHAVTPGQLHRRIGGRPWPSELQELAAAFDAMLARLDEAFERLSAFSSDVAHDLRTPLNNCLGEVEVALSKPREPEEYRRILESSLEELKRLARMVESLLFLARADNARARLEMRRLAVQEEFEAVAALYDALAQEQGVRLLCSGTGTVWADPTLLRRALSNLVANALAHTPDGGTVSLEASPVEGGGVRLRVRDTGTGIPPEDLPRLFQRFHRSATSRDRHPQGLGLGLSIVKSIMEMHGGSVSVESAWAAGATVSLEFPSKRT